MTKMKAFLRVMRALFIRLMFMAYMLLCIWRITFVSDNKYYWLMIISVGFLLIETAILLWLRAGKEFKGILPSVLFFLSCVIPSIWIMSIDEANRKNKFQILVESQETKIKDYVLSLDIAKTSSTSNNVGSIRSQLINATKRSILTTLEGITRASREVRSIHNYSQGSLLGSSRHSKLDQLDHKSSSEKNVECCDVKISYWFQEDNFQHLFFQSLMLVLVTSRWLITRSELNLNQRSLILVISVATAADTLDFFSYLNMEIVYRNNYLLFSVLLILSLSLIQFVFLHIEENFSLNSSANMANTLNSGIEEDSDNVFKDSKDHSKNGKFSIISRHYQFLKKHLKADTTLPRNSHNPYPFDKLIKPPLNNMQPMNKNNARRFFCYVFCCCLEQQDPLFFILLAGLFLHDGSYLTFRIFALSKLGWETIINQNPLLIFFMIKNIFIILTQIYKVYTVSNEKRQKKLLENYRDFVMAHQENVNQNNNFLPPNQIAAAATGGQVPLMPINTFPNFNKPVFQSNNPYRFAQIYTGPVQNEHNQNRHMLKRTMSSLDTNNNNSGFFTDGTNYKSGGLLDTTRNNENPYGNGYYLNNTSFQSGSSIQFHQGINSSDSFQNYLYKQQYDANITMCQNQLDTSGNPFSAKVGKALYGLPFMSRSKSSLSGQDTSNLTNGGGFVSTFRNNSFNRSSNSNKNLKASKI